MKIFKVFIKSFEAPQRNVKIKILNNFYFNPGSEWEGLILHRSCKKSFKQEMLQKGTISKLIPSLAVSTTSCSEEDAQ